MTTCFGDDDVKTVRDNVELVLDLFEVHEEVVHGPAWADAVLADESG